MNTSDTRVTKAQAAKLADVSPRQINRWAKVGLLTVEYTGADPGSLLATYDPEEVRAAPEKWRKILRGPWEGVLQDGGLPGA